MKKIKYLATALLVVMALGTVSCRNKRISYTDMIKRETKEVKAFMDKEGFSVVDNLPADLAMQPNQFYEIKNEAGVGLGVFINVIHPGEVSDMAKSGKTPVSVRFSYTAIGDRMKGAYTSFSNIGASDSESPAATFIYQSNVNTDFRQGSFQPAPNSTAGEESMQPFVCNAMMLALKHVPIGSTIKMIASFREGPAFTLKASSSFANENDTGVALFYDKMTFSHKK